MIKKEFHQNLGIMKGILSMSLQYGKDTEVQDPINRQLTLFRSKQHCSDAYDPVQADIFLLRGRVL